MIRVQICIHFHIYNDNTVCSLMGVRNKVDLCRI